ncbi:NAD(P)/FAD-dependent oxidoreductase [Spelaeicoccus albus]|uniref:Glycine/D-amino acid oxidase-like deaminating enzyme n=1 Tax=Spelaeicoccus albus TaxID=1280376 RepID=A0A7Z0AAQ1_9MICO|nr:FAD-dependent oxidoreductase [Spelaeicoccus albus]NYI66736.1 glycine/D-amino acid oxidase-like deaminating enzyme [Spelaeicoccus albus]
MPDAIVIGAGIMGASIALELAKTRRRVVVLDKSGGPGNGSTSASSSVVRFNYSTLDGVATAWEARHCWAAWHDHLGFTDPAGTAAFKRTGMLCLDSPPAPRSDVLAHFDTAGVPYREYTTGELAAAFPMLDTGSYWPNKPVTDDAFWSDPTGRLGGYLTPDAGYIDDPQLAAHNLAAAATDRGAEFRFHAQVSAIDTAPGGVRRVRLAGGDQVEAPIVVNAAGPWSAAVNRLAGVGDDFTVTVRPMRQEVHQIDSPDGVTPPGGLDVALADVDLGTYMRPGAHHSLLIGGTEPECDGFEWLADPDEANPAATRGRFEAQVLRAARRLPGLTVPTRVKGVAGVYDVASDWTPIYDKTDAPGFYVAMGTSGNQFKNAPLVGRFMAAIIGHTEDGYDHDADPAGYECEFTGGRVNLAAFSRKRPVNRANSGTVMG